MTRICGECKSEVSVQEFQWTYDRHGIPWRKVCFDCVDKASEQVADWKFDASDAGESLEPGDY